jgi:hypothetical protein
LAGYCPFVGAAVEGCPCDACVEVHVLFEVESLFDVGEVALEFVDALEQSALVHFLPAR